MAYKLTSPTMLRGQSADTCCGNSKVPINRRPWNCYACSLTVKTYIRLWLISRIFASDIAFLWLAGCRISTRNCKVNLPWLTNFICTLELLMRRTFLRRLLADLTEIIKFVLLVSVSSNQLVGCLTSRLVSSVTESHSLYALLCYATFSVDAVSYMRLRNCANSATRQRQSRSLTPSTSDCLTVEILCYLHRSW